MASPRRIERALVLPGAPGAIYRAGRSVRAIAGQVEQIVDLTEASPAEIAQALLTSTTETWLVSAGAWPLRPPEAPPGGGANRCGVGAVYDANAETAAPPAAMTAGWRELLSRTGGDLHHATLPPLHSAWIDAAFALALGEEWGRRPGTLDQVLQRAIASATPRVFRWAALDVAQDERLRVAQIITSLQRGGAERVAIDLYQTIGRFGIHPLLITAGRSPRAEYPAPRGTIDVADTPGGRPARIQAAADAAVAARCDVAHIHLLNKADLATIRAAHLPVLLTIHNMPQGWQPGTDSLSPADADLVVGCADAVTHALQEAGVTSELRTVRNGIDLAHYQPDADRDARARALREQWGIAAEDWVLLAVANPRPQKRLHRLPGILQRVREAVADRAVWVVIAGAASELVPDSVAEMKRIEEALDRTGQRDHVKLIGSFDDVACLLRAGDMMVSTSAWEGLSLAHLEALASARPVVATDVGGTREIAWRNPAMTLIPAEFTDEEAAEAVIRAMGYTGAGVAQTGVTQAGVAQAGIAPPADDFRRERMAQRYAHLAPRAVALYRQHTAPASPRTDLWLIANNFSTGGAQSSARRMLLSLKDKGYTCRVAVVQEEPDRPTPGCAALIEAGIPVLAAPPSDAAGVDPALASLLETLDTHRPRAVIFWNLITRYKVHLADLLPRSVRVFDLSPGEMYFTSLRQYFDAPHPSLPYRTPQEYGRLLAGMVVKFSDEAALARQTLGIEPVAVIPNGIAVPGTCPPPRAADGRFVIGTAARLSPQKKLEELLDGLRLAAPRLGNYLLRIAGGVDGADTAYPEVLRARAQGLNIEWLGDVADIPAFHRTLDVFAMISEPAGCPNASMEAMAAGLPVIATDFGGARDQVLDGITGRLTPRNHPLALADALLAAAASPDQRRAWSIAGWQRARDHFSLDRMRQAYIDFLRLDDR